MEKNATLNTFAVMQEYIEVDLQGIKLKEKIKRALAERKNRGRGCLLIIDETVTLRELRHIPAGEIYFLNGFALRAAAAATSDSGVPHEAPKAKSPREEMVKNFFDAIELMRMP